MKLDTFMIVTKGMAHLAVGVFLPWSAALAQWINSGEWPPRIIWIAVIMPASVIGAGNAWIAFTSGAFHLFEQQKKADATGEEQVTVVKPTGTNGTKEPGKIE